MIFVISSRWYCAYTGHKCVEWRKYESYNQSSTFIWPGVPDPAVSEEKLAPKTMEKYQRTCSYKKN